ncbi:manganese efflux pump [Desulfohalovibrio reitneri]|uniref:manganese efflux pump MntP n=1 Tax=Desulfohalovibrio reitneri TaxID=1307759 RepID=UPI0004A7652E
MGWLRVLSLAVALAMDALAVAAATGATRPRVSARATFRLAFHFGLFQGGMTALGWLGGTALRPFIEGFAHWAAFILLFLVGANMLREALFPDEDHTRPDPTRGATLVLLSVATSLDALAVGLSLALLGQPVLFPSLVIGVVALLFTAAGLHAGNFLARMLPVGRLADAAGGLILWTIGVRILAEHDVL